MAWKGGNRKGVSIETLIGQGTTVTGDIDFSGGLHLVGRVEGNLSGADASSRLHVSEEGNVVGEIRVATVMVSGAVEGDIHAGERLILGAGARVQGNVYYHTLEMAAGAQVNGKLVHRPRNAEPLALEHRDGQLQTGEDEATVNR